MISPNKLFIAFGIVSSVGATAQTVHEFTLAEAMNYAVQHSYQIQQSNIDVEVSSRKVKETTAIGLPQVNGEATFNNYIDIPTQVAPADAFGFPGYLTNFLGAVSEETGIPINAPATDPNAVTEFQFGQKYTMSAGVTASQLLFDGSYFVGLKAAKAYLQYARLGKEKTEIEIKNSVTQAYFSALAARENIEALKENQKNMETIYSETSALYETGFLEKQDADQVRLLRSNINYQLDFARRQQQNILNLLKFQMGIPLSDSIVLKDSIETIVEAQTSNSLAVLDQGFSADKHIDFRTLAQNEELSQLNLSNERARSYPQMSAFFNHSQNAYRDEFDFLNGGSWYPTTLWGVQLKVPIFSSLRSYHRTQQAKLDLEKVKLQKLQLEQNLYMQASSARNDYSSALERYQTMKEDLELAESIKERTRVKYNEGLASSNDLTQTENQYLTTLGNYINTTLELLNAKLALDKALGNY